jgi:tetratricopeptide (TPR) repeat protein
MARTIMMRFMYAALVTLLSACMRPDKESVVRVYLHAVGTYDSGRLEAARLEAAKVLSLDSDFFPALMLAGKIAYFLDDDADAILYFERGTAGSPKGGEAALWLARAYRNAGRSADAKKTCEMLLSSDPSNPSVLRFASTLALDGKDVSAALVYLNRAIASAAETGLAFTDRAALRWAAGDRPGTLADLDSAMILLPHDSSAHKAASELRIVAAMK